MLTAACVMFQSVEREKSQASFGVTARVIIATSAWGMGLDATIRLVVHFRCVIALPTC